MAISSGKTACVFPGQGSQRKGMGAEFFDRYPALRATADEILGYSIQDLCLRDPQRQLRFTAFTQPALFVANALIWLDRAQRKAPPDFLAGHSLGEYNALFAAGCFDFETGLRLVQQRGALMGRVRDGGMAAVLGLDAERVAEVLQERNAPVDIANFNLASQLVISGPRDELEKLIQPMETAGARKCIVLNVSGAFHSRYMAETAAEFEDFLNSFRFAAPEIEVVANTSALPYSADTVARHLADQIRSPVRWAQTMDYLRHQGVTELEELGPGKVLQKLWASALEAPAPEVPAPEVATPEAADPEAASEAPQASGFRAAAQLGAPTFRRDYGLRQAYVAGSPAPGVRTPELVINLARAGFLGFLDISTQAAATQAIGSVVQALGPEGSFGVCLRPPTAEAAKQDDQIVTAALEQGVRFAEAVGYPRVTPALVRFRFTGAHRDATGQPVVPRRLLALITQPATAALFTRPAPESIVTALVEQGELTAEEGEIARQLPVSGDLCAVADPANGAEMTTLLPAMLRHRDHGAHGGAHPIRIGAGGALGTPEAIACAFLLGADFVQTSAINLTAVEAATPREIKELLASLESGETTDVPAADGFMLGARTRVVKKGSLFAPRAEKLYQLFRSHDSLESIDPGLRKKLEATCFKRSFDSVWEDLRDRSSSHGSDPKQKMALVFGGYLRQSLRWAFAGHANEKLNHQIPCDESMAAFNLYAENTPLADPAQRTAAAMATALMRDAAAFLAQRIEGLAPQKLSRLQGQHAPT